MNGHRQGQQLRDRGVSQSGLAMGAQVGGGRGLWDWLCRGGGIVARRVVARGVLEFGPQWGEFAHRWRRRSRDRLRCGVPRGFVRSRYLRWRRRRSDRGQLRNASAGWPADHFVDGGRRRRCHERRVCHLCRYDDEHRIRGIDRWGDRAADGGRDRPGYLYRRRQRESRLFRALGRCWRVHGRTFGLDGGYRFEQLVGIGLPPARGGSLVCVRIARWLAHRLSGDHGGGLGDAAGLHH